MQMLVINILTSQKMQVETRRKERREERNQEPTPQRPLTLTYPPRPGK